MKPTSCKELKPQLANLYFDLAKQVEMKPTSCKELKQPVWVVGFGVVLHL